MLHKYIPVQYNRLYYVYDCMDGSLYPCDKNVYFAFRKYTFSELLEKYKNNNPEGSISNFIQMLLKANSCPLRNRRFQRKNKLSQANLRNQQTLVTQIRGVVVMLR